MLIIALIATTVFCFILVCCLIRSIRKYKIQKKIYEKRIALKENTIQKLKNSYREMVMALSLALDESDRYTSGHSERVTKYALEIAKKFKFTKAQLRQLKYAGILHDIGKLGVKSEILDKKGALTPEEYNEIKKHALIAKYILAPVIELRKILPIIIHHHERYNGEGYPAKLKAKKIPLGARILAVADAFDAMTSDRLYREALSVEHAVKVLKQEKGKQFDPQVVNVFLKLLKEKKIKKEVTTK